MSAAEEDSGLREVGERVRAYVERVRALSGGERAQRSLGREEERDELAVECTKNSHLLYELSYLKSEMNARDQEIISLSLTIQQMRLEAGDLSGKYCKLQRELEESKAKNARLADHILTYENNISTLTQKIDFQDHFFSKKLEVMKEKFDAYLEKMVEMDFQNEKAKEREFQWPLILERVHKTAQQEYNKFKTETEGHFGQRISSIQNQLDVEVSENTQLKEVNDDLNSKVLQLRKTDVELRSKVEQLEKQNEILEEALQKDKIESDKTIATLQSKMKQLQDDFKHKVDDVKHGKVSECAPTKGEIEFIKRLLTEEEERLNIGINDGAQNHQDRYETGNMSEEDVEDEARNKYMNNTSGEEFVPYECEERSLDQVQRYIQPLKETNPSRDAANVDNTFQWSGRQEEDKFIQTPSLVGPVFYSQHVVGPVRPLSTPHPPSDRPPRPSSANPHGIRSKNVCPQQDYNQECPSRSSNQRADSGLGQSPDYFDSLFKMKKKTVEVVGHAEDSISLTCVKVLEVNKDGKYIRICNNSESQDAEIGSYIIKQNKFSHPVALFRFPERMKLPVNATVTVWSGSNDPLLHQPPTDFYSEEPYSWGSGPEYTTILCNPLGQAVSWTTQPHRINPDPYRAKTAPTMPKENKRESSKKLPELISTSNAVFLEQPFLIRNNDSAMSHPIYHPFTSTPKSSIHPCVENNRGKVIGNDNSSFNRQTRQQNDGIPDPMIGQPYTGTNTQRIVGSARVLRYYPGTIQPSHTLNNRTPDVIFRSNTEPPNNFQKPLSRFMTGLDQIQSMHNHFYNPPMFKAEPNSSVN